MRSFIADELRGYTRAQYGINKDYFKLSITQSYSGPIINMWSWKHKHNRSTLNIHIFYSINCCDFGKCVTESV